MKETDLIEQLAEGLSDFYPLPDIKPIAKTINRLYVKLRVCGLSAEQVEIKVNALLSKHNVAKEDIFPDSNYD